MVVRQLKSKFGPLAESFGIGKEYIVVPLGPAAVEYSALSLLLSELYRDGKCETSHEALHAIAHVLDTGNNE